MPFTSLLKLTARLFLFLSVLSIPALAQITTLASFNNGNGRDPGYPTAPFVQGTDGNLYGTTAAGGGADQGTVFRMTPAGQLVTLYHFCSQPGCSDGAVANGGLIQATDGNFYGTTDVGGINNDGTVFKMTPAGKLTTLYRFCSVSGCPDGANPSAGLLQASDGNFYGTTSVGGLFGQGTVFKITTTGSLTTLVNFDATNGFGPDFGSLIQGTDGNLFGTTVGGGVNTTCGSGLACPTVFRMSLRGSLTTLYLFCAKPNCTTRSEIFGGLVQGTDGSLYGTTAIDDTNAYGTIFKVTAPGKLKTLYSFNFSDGAYPEAALIQGTDGNFYGTTSNGGAHGFSGTLFAITPAGNFTTLYNFCSEANCADGTGPFASLMQATNGTFYGTTFAGGTSTNCIGGCGTAFSLSMGLAPFVETRLSSGRPGARIIVLGNNLTGTNAVSFNGATAAFTVVSGTEIVATVPIGATTGFLTVATPSGTLTSNKAFQVLH